MQSAMEAGITAARRPNFSNAAHLSGSPALGRLTTAASMVVRPYRWIWEISAQSRPARIKKSEYSVRGGEGDPARRAGYKRSQRVRGRYVSIRADFHLAPGRRRWVRYPAAEPIGQHRGARASGSAGDPRRASRREPRRHARGPAPARTRNPMLSVNRGRRRALGDQAVKLGAQPRQHFVVLEVADLAILDLEVDRGRPAP